MSLDGGKIDVVYHIMHGEGFPFMHGPSAKQNHGMFLFQNEAEIIEYVHFSNKLKCECIEYFLKGDSVSFFR